MQHDGEVVRAIKELANKTDLLREDIQTIKPTFASVAASNVNRPDSASTATTTDPKNTSTRQSAKAGNSSVVNKNASQNSGKSAHNPRIPTKTVSKNVLLVGDSNLSKVNPKGLKDNVHKHAVPGATIKSLTTDMKLFNMKMFDKVIVYVGGNDIANNMDIELIEEN